MRNTLPTFAMLAALGWAPVHAASAPASAPAAAASASAAAAVPHLCGGVGFDGRAAMRRHAHEYNLGIWLTTIHAAYLAEMPITVSRDGKVVAQFVSDGPLCYLKLPAGDYTVSSTRHGETRSVKMHTGQMDAYLRF
ncbi:hypothetical protein GALL_339710 [mine drainage metagenome]|jgi:hypothetical protein|uniref:Carboxypeptidase regulatory-like domain-containing protein n=1 Tax=mine drainage metagenome TaxID=410659 RepID=A0A1J5QWI8_9ZZZZ